jgi:hypothetical protein
MFVLQPAGALPQILGAESITMAARTQGHGCGGMRKAVLPIVRDRCFVAGNVLRIRE